MISTTRPRPFTAGDRVYLDLYGFGPGNPGTIHADADGLHIILDQDLQAHPGEGAEVWAFDAEYTRHLEPAR